jgi:aspartate kinase/aspartokinase/homoserine dehydrogenase 1
MSDCVVRFGGNYCIDPTHIQKFAVYLKDRPYRCVAVVSAIPEISDEITRYFENVFSEQANSGSLKNSLSRIFSAVTRQNPSDEFLALSIKVESLLEGISLIGDYSDALKDQVLSFTEKLSAVVLSNQLTKEGLKTHILFPEENSFRVTNDFGNATHLSFGERITVLPDDRIYIIPGSYGITTSGKIARAGISASDYTAASLASWLNAPELILWGLDKPFTCTDSSIVENTDKIARLTYAEASELAYFDHYSLHPRCVEPLEEKHIPVKVIHPETFEVETIINTETYVSEQVVKGVAYSDDISLLKLDGPGVGLKPGILAKTTAALAENGINVKSVITSQVSINFILSKNEGQAALGYIDGLGFTSVKTISLVDDVTLIGIVGHGMQQHYGVSAKIFTAVAQNRINVLLSGSGASDLVSYLIVKQSDKTKSIRAIYQAFFEE